jgi:hypothetical protein
MSRVNMSAKKSTADLIYGYNVTGEGDNARATTWATWFNKDQSFTFSFHMSHDSTKALFEKITNQIKTECVYYKLEGKKIYYSCPKSKYKGKIAFLIEGTSTSKTGYIKNYPLATKRKED